MRRCVNKCERRDAGRELDVHFDGRGELALEVISLVSLGRVSPETQPGRHKRPVGGACTLAAR
jgi:hypothetical protein